MNSWNGIGRMTKDPVVRYTEKQVAIASFSLAIARGGKDDPVDYVPCKAIGKTAEIVEKYSYKGQRVGINGTIQTGSYEKDGHKVYTTDVVAENIEFCEKKKADGSEGQPKQNESDEFMKIPDGIQEEIPFV